MKEHAKSIGPHDLGGKPAGPIVQGEHEVTFWERRVDAMIYLLFKKGVVKDWSQVRHRIESLGPEVYEKLSYYERWAGAAGTLLLEEGVIAEEELEARIAEIRSRSKTDDTV